MWEKPEKGGLGGRKPSVGHKKRLKTILAKKYQFNLRGTTVVKSQWGSLNTGNNQKVARSGTARGGFSVQNGLTKEEREAGQGRQNWGGTEYKYDHETRRADEQKKSRREEKNCCGGSGGVEGERNRLAKKGD